MIYRFSDEEWTLLERRLQALRPFMISPRFSGIQNALSSMGRDHVIRTRRQLDMMLLLTQTELPEDGKAEAETEKMPIRLPAQENVSRDALLRLSALHDTLRYFRDIRRGHDADRRHERER